MTVLEHIKQLVVGLTPTEKQDLTDYLSDSQRELLTETPESLRGDWSVAFATEGNFENDLKEIRAQSRRQ